MEEWKEYKLGDVASVQTGPFGSQLHNKDYVKAGTPIVTVEHLGARLFSTQNLPCVSDVDKVRLGKYTLEEGDIVFSRVGSVDRCSYVSAKEVGWLFSGRCLRVRCNDTIQPMFLYYYLQKEEVKQSIRNIAVGATMPSINTKLLSEIQIIAPSKTSQKLIASTLSSLDDKIECNRRINDNFTLLFLLLACFVLWLLKLRNDNLEQLAQTVLKNWKEQVKQRAHYSTKLETIALFVGGYSYKGKELKPSKKAMATIKNFDRNGGFKLDGYKEIEPSDKVKPGQFVNMFDILVAHTDLTQNAEVIGNAEMVLSFDGYERIVFSMDLVKVIPQDVFPFKFLLAALLRDSDFKSHCMGYVNGTTVLHMSKKALPEFEVLLPKDQSSICQIDTYLSNIYRKMAEIVSESSHLSTLRDTLLPQLMSGELIINELTM